MSRQGGYRGMGSHKHGISGVAPANKTNTMRRCREENERLKIKQRFKNLKKSKMFHSISDLFREVNNE